MNDQMNQYPVAAQQPPVPDEVFQPQGHESLASRLASWRVGIGLLAAGALLGGCTATGHTEARPSASAGVSYSALPSPDASPTASATESAPPSHEGMENSTDPQLKLLAGYERGSGVRVNEMMLFVGLPKDPEGAKQQASSLVGTLTEYAKYGVKPLIVLEPTHDGKADVDLPQLETTLTAPDASGQTILGAYADTLKSGAEAAGLTGDEQGTWVILSEPNLAEWANSVTDPSIFVRNYKLLAGAIKGALPDAKRAVLLNNISYPNGNLNEDKPDGRIETLLGYLQGLRDLVDVFAYQGFQWSANDKAGDYLDAQKAITCADTVGASEVILNTGSVGSIPVAGRKANLAAEVQQAAQVQAAGKRVTINWYVRNDKKDGDPSATDWSFGGTQRPALDGAMQAAAKRGIDVSLFDA